MADDERINRAPRIQSNQEAMLVDGDGGVLPVVVSDVSRDGCKLMTDGTLSVGEQVVIRTPRDGDVRATIRWVRGRDAGAEFSNQPPREMR